MLSNRELEVVMSLRDEVSKKLQGIQANLAKFSDSTKDLGLQMRKTGREISYVGSSMIMLGTAITAPLIAAYKEAGKYNADIAKQLNETKYTFQNLAISIGTALLPAMKKITDQTARVVDWWNNLDRTTRDKLIQSIFNLGKAVIALGLAFTIVGRSIASLANLALLLSNLVLLDPRIAGLTLLIGGLVIAMVKWQAVCNVVINTLEVLASWVNTVVDYLLVLKNALTFNWGDVKKDLQDIHNQTVAWMTILSGKNGPTANYLDNLRQQIADIQKAFSGIGNTKNPNAEREGGTLLSGFKLGIEQAQEALGSFRSWGVQAAMDLASGMQSNFKTFFVDAFHGQLKTAQDYFAAWGNMVIDIVANVVSKMLEQWALTKVMGLFGSFSGAAGTTGTTASTISAPKLSGSMGGLYGGFHSGGVIRAHNGLAIDEVPIIVQTGERVLSRSQNRQYEKMLATGGENHIHYHSTVVIKAWDFADIYSNKDTIEGIINESLRRQGTVAKSIKKYS